MARMIRSLLLLLIFFTSAIAISAEPGFQSISLIFSETWTGNAFVPPAYPVTGSDGAPIDMSVGGGARFNLVDPFLLRTGALTIDPRLTLGTRYYLLYQTGRVVPTQPETALGQDENGDEGFGSARVLTVSIIAPVGMEFGLGEKVAMTVGFSPTLVFRFRAGDAVFLNQKSDLIGMYTFFYDHLRWFRPELHLAGRFDVSENLSFALRATSSLSIWDMADATLPWWDQFQVAGVIEFNLTPPLAALIRKPEESTEPAVPQTAE